MDWFLYIVFNFILYSFLGWILEEVYCFITRGYFKKEGFLKGTFKPMYGISICILIFCYKRLNIIGIPLALLCIIVPTSVEFISGYLLKKYFGKVYWDYSDIRFNYKGIICARFSIYWSILVMLDIIYIQPLVDRFYYYYDYLSIILSLGLGFGICVDLFITLKENFKEISKYYN